MVPGYPGTPGYLKVVGSGASVLERTARKEGEKYAIYWCQVGERDSCPESGPAGPDPGTTVQYGYTPGHRVLILL